MFAPRCPLLVASDPDGKPRLVPSTLLHAIPRVHHAPRTVPSSPLLSSSPGWGQRSSTSSQAQPAIAPSTPHTLAFVVQPPQAQPAVRAQLTIYISRLPSWEQGSWTSSQALPAIGGEKYVAGDFFKFPTGWHDHFDWIWEHTCFCAIDPEHRADYVNAVRTQLKPGGHLLGVFYLNPYDEEHESGDGPPFGCSEQELRERFVETAGLEWVESYVPAQAYPGRAGRELVVRLRKP